VRNHGHDRSDCDIYDLEAITRVNYRQRVGWTNLVRRDAGPAGSRRASSSEQTGWPGPHFGRAGELDELARRVAFRQGIGDRLAEGSYRLAESCGHPEFSMTVKKQEIPAYDPRASFTQALGYMTSPSGACHLKGGYAISLAFSGGPRKSPASAFFNRRSASAICTTSASSRTAWASAGSRVTLFPMIPGPG
jgi:aldehyde:ferredoxin oxidoreductase